MFFIKLFILRFLKSNWCWMVFEMSKKNYYYVGFYIFHLEFLRAKLNIGSTLSSYSGFLVTSKRWFLILGSILNTYFCLFSRVCQREVHLGQYSERCSIRKSLCILTQNTSLCILFDLDNWGCFMMKKF